MNFTEEEKQALREFSIIKESRKGDCIIEPGKFTRKCFFILKGCMRYFHIVDGDEKTTAFFEENDSITPQSYYKNRPDDFYLECTETTIYTQFSPENEAVFLKKFPRFESICRIKTEEQIIKMQEEFSDFMKSSPEQRYISLMKNRPGLLQRVPQYYIASYIGVKPESLSRLRKRILTNQY